MTSLLELAPWAVGGAVWGTVFVALWDKYQRKYEEFGTALEEARQEWAAIRAVCEDARAWRHLQGELTVKEQWARLERTKAKHDANIGKCNADFTAAWRMVLCWRVATSITALGFCISTLRGLL